MKSYDNASMNEMRQHIAQSLTDQGFPPSEITAFLAGATILGHLTPGGCLWYVRHRCRNVIDRCYPGDSTIESYGRREG